jgi:hypothetical protein
MSTTSQMESPLLAQIRLLASLRSGLSPPERDPTATTLPEEGPNNSIRSNSIICRAGSTGAESTGRTVDNDEKPGASGSSVEPHHSRDHREEPGTGNIMNRGPHP